MNDDSKQALRDGSRAISQAMDAQRSRLRQELQELAKFYVSMHDGDGQQGMEAMCDDFFERTAESLHPGGWAGMIRYAMKRAG